MRSMKAMKSTTAIRQSKKAVKAKPSSPAAAPPAALLSAGLAAPVFIGAELANALKHWTVEMQGWGSDIGQLYVFRMVDTQHLECVTTVEAEQA